VLKLSNLPAGALADQLVGPGLRLRTGPVAFCIRSEVPEVRDGLAALYPNHTVVGTDEFVDFQVSIDMARSLRRWIRPKLYFGIDGDSPFAPLPGNQGLPMLEWGLNWCVTGHCHQYLVLHAAVLERNGRALVMPAPSGSGKSTLCAALLFRGWRLLSDELAIIEPETGRLVPMPRAVSLKNASIEVISGFAGQAVQFGSIVRDTLKGRVGHFAAPADSVERGDETVKPGWVVFPRYEAGASARLAPLARGEALMALIENAFNYNVHRASGFQTLADLVQASRCHRFSYSKLDEAVELFEAMASEAPAP
jgi:hypothetical protein